jgi:quaternary ammonium compound-resistance protein SugE
MQRRAQELIMSWFLLVVAGLFEVAWASLLAETKGFTRVVPTVGFVLTLGISMFLLHLATRTIPIGTGYAVWVGIGAVGAFVVAVVFRGQPTSIGQVLAIAALVASIVAVKLTATH